MTPHDDHRLNPRDQSAVAWRTGSEVTSNYERAKNWIALGMRVWALVDAYPLHKEK